MARQSSVRGGSRFLKVPTPAESGQSPVSKMLQEPRYVSPRPGHQTAALARLSEIENHIRSRRQALEQTRQAAYSPTLTSHLTVSPPAAVDAAQQVSTGAQSQRSNRFLKNKSAGFVESTNTSTAVAPQSADGLSLRARTSDAAALSADLETNPERRMSSVSVESDEEYMQKLLGDLMDSSEHSFLGPGRTSSMKREDKMLHRSSQKVQSTAPPAAAHPPLPSNVPPSCSSASPSRCSSPFRFTSKTLSHFSPSVVPTSPSPLLVSILPSERMDSPHNSQSSEHSALSSYGGAKVLSLDQLFQVGRASEDPHSQMSSVSSEDFKINVMTLDQLIPAAVGITSETPGKQIKMKHKDPVSGSWNKHQQVPQEEEQVEEALNYQSDFDSYLSGDEGAAASLGTQEERTKHSSSFSDPSGLSISQISEHSQKSKLISKSSKPGSSASPRCHSSYQSSRRYTSAVRDTAVQTQPHPMMDSWSTVAVSADMATLDPTVARLYINPSPMVTHAVSAARLEAISVSDPAAFALNELLKQQLATTRRFIDSSDHLHSCLRRSLEPPNYRYTTLKDTLQTISKHRVPSRTAEKASK